jgi:radical SAM family uncharacterized protein/radical SAM-linked protein
MNQEMKTIWERLLPFVQKPGRYLGGETHSTIKNLDQIKAHICLCYPDIYEIGMSHNGLKILYHLLNQDPDVYAERAFAPWPDMGDLLKKKNIPLVSLETKTPIHDFDLLGISLQSSFTFTNVLYVLELSKIPLLSKEREDKDPIVFAGGPCTVNPSPLERFIDGFVIGDGEEVILKIAQILKQEPSRPLRLKRLAELDGIYIPTIHKDKGSHQTIKRLWTTKLKSDDFPKKPIIPLIELVHDRVGIEVMRGCTHGCRFCQAGYIYRPVREMDVDDTLTLIDNNLNATGFRDLGLLSLSTADYSQIGPLTSELGKSLRKRRISISLPSLRADSFSLNLAENVGEIKKRGFTFAPEAGSERLRRIINKDISDAKLMETAEKAFQAGWNQLKLYFMIGLPTETQDDIFSIRTLLDRLASLAKKHGKRRMITASIGVFVPKPFTPFQWASFGPLKEIEEKLKYLHDTVTDRRIQIRWQDPKQALIEFLLTRGDSSIGDLIHQAYLEGTLMDGWAEYFDFSKWQRAIVESKCDVDSLTREIPIEKELPWSFIDIGVQLGFLKKEYKKSKNGEQTPDCKWDECHHCGLPGKEEGLVLAKPLSSKIEIPDLPEGEVRRFLLTFEKVGNARFLSHRQVIRLLEMAFCQTKTPLHFSRGFTPRPSFVLGTALPLGTASKSEYLLFETTGPLPESIINDLNLGLPEGIQALSIKENPDKKMVTKPGKITFSLRPLPTTEKEKIESLLFQAEELKQRISQEADKEIGLGSIEIKPEPFPEIILTLLWDKETNRPPRPSDFLQDHLKIESPWSSNFLLTKES